MVMESSVHFIAALRMLAEAAGLGEAVEATARTTHARPDLSGPDTIVGFLTFGRPGGGAAAGNVATSVSISLASSHVSLTAAALSPFFLLPGPVAVFFSPDTYFSISSVLLMQVHFGLRVIGTNGTIEVGRGGWTGTRTGYTLTRKFSGEAEPVSQVMSFTGLANEYLAALKTIVTGEEDPRGLPEEGARDLAAVQALLESGKKGGERVPIPVVP
jgi:hypothetical protein